jgi:uncharacterized protein GlcG (DUF336 family)
MALSGPFPRKALAFVLTAAVLPLPCPVVAADSPLTAAEVDRIVRQAAAEAQRLGLKAHVAVTDQEGHVLARFRMAGAPETSRVRPRPGEEGRRGHGLEGVDLPATFVAVTKAGTGAFLSSGGNAFSTRTASFIVQEHFPPLVDFTPGGPLFGVQFSSLPCSDVKSPPLPAGLSADPGGLPLYRNGQLVGGVGVEGDGSYTVDPDPRDLDTPPEEQAAAAGARGFESPDLIRADRILADGIRLPYANAEAGAGGSAVAGDYLDGPRDGPASAFRPATLGDLNGESDPRFPTRAGAALSADEVTRILTQAARQASITRAAIRQPLGSSARVSIAVVDVDGRVLGNFRTADAPVFGFDVAVQKARTANFFSRRGAADDLRRAGLAAYLGDGVPLDGSIAFTSRAVGFLAQPLYPPGIDGTDAGPFSSPRAEWSPFNTGLQLDLVEDALFSFLATLRAPGACSAAIPALANGITIFPGGVPLYKNGALAGAVGISGDGVDQDDLIASAGAAGFDAPAEKRSDQLVIRGVRLPYVKFPRHPDL